MDAFLNPGNGASLTDIVDVTAHSISSFQKSETPKNINETHILKNDIRIAEPIDGQINELGNNVTTMYQLNGTTNDEKVAASEAYSII